MAEAWKETYQIIDEDTLRLAENAPMIPPSVSPGVDADRDVNNLIGKTFQFTYQWVYKDYRYSILSPYSDIVVSDELALGSTTYLNDLNNKITISCPTGNTEVIALRILAREGNAGSWFVCYTHEYVDQNVPAIAFVFYDDNVREYIDITSALTTYHNVPRSAKNIEIVENKVVLSDCLTGYDPTLVNYDLGVTYGHDSSTPDNIVIPVTFTATRNNDFHHTELGLLTVPAVSAGRTVVIDVYWKVNCQYKVSSWFSSYNESHVFTFRLAKTMTVYSDYTASEFSDFLFNEIKELPSLMREVTYSRDSSQIGTQEWEIETTQTSNGSNYYIRFYAVCTGGINVTRTVTNNSKLTYLKGFESTFKKYSSYNVGISYYDKVGRTSGVLTCKNKSVYIPGDSVRAAGDKGMPSYVSFTIRSAAPSWASYFRMCVSESINLSEVWAIHSNKNVYAINQDGQAVLAIDTNATDYEFVQGDVLVLEQTSANPITKPVLGRMSLVTSGGTDYAGNFIIVPKDSNVVGDYDETPLYIHRPKSITEDVVYFEDTFTGTCANGVHSVTSGVITCGDAWLKTRVYNYIATPSSYTYKGEDFYVSRELGIRAYSKGRPMVSLKDYGAKQQPILMWGGNYFRDTKTNEIASFLLSDTMMMDAQHGPISYMALVGDVLKLLQTRKETSIYVGKNVFTDAAGNAMLAKVNSLFGNQNPAASDYGANMKTAVVAHDRNLFYWDQDKGAVIQSSPNGIIEISRYKMQSYFRTKKRQIDVAISENSPYQVLFGYNAKHEELMVLFRIYNANATVKDIVDVAVFNPERNKWTMFLDMTKTIGGVVYNPDAFMTMGSGMAVTLGGLMYQHNIEDYQIGENNYIYDEAKPISITAPLNDMPTIDKDLKNMSLDCDGVVHVEAETPISSTAPVGQFTYNNSSTFRTKSGRRDAPFFRSVRVANGTNNANLLHTGRSMQGRWALLTVKSTNPRGFEFRDMVVNWQAV